MKKLPFSSKDFADYLVKYDNSCECDAFDFDGISESKHEDLLNAAEKLMNSMDHALDYKVLFSSLAEVLIQLDLHTKQYGTSKSFWLDVFERVAKENIFHWIVENLTATPSIAADSIHAGLFDYYVEKDDLYSFLTDVNAGSCCFDGSSILAVSSAWCKRKSSLEKNKTRKV